jgi:hypothetical protein
VTLLLPFGPLHGVNIALVKQAARFMMDMDSAELYDFAVSLGIGLTTVEPIWRAFISDGYIGESEGRFVPTQRMAQLPMARFGKPLPRKKAAVLLEQAIANAQAVNAEPADAQLYYVTSLAVFGSYLDESKSELGDLDLAWSLEERPGIQNFIHHCIMYNRDSVAPTRGRVRPRSSFVRLTDMGNLLKLKCPYEVVYEFKSPVIDQVRADRERKRAEHRVHIQQMAVHMKELRASLDEHQTGSRRRKR